jgi:hypothetical protein
MTREEKAKLLDIRKRGKCGRSLSKEEHDFCTACFEQFPEEYREIEKELHSWVSTAPWWELL